MASRVRLDEQKTTGTPRGCVVRRYVSIGALILGAVVFSTAVLVACGGGAAYPTAPPAPVPTPVPVPSATPDPDVPPAGSACGKPYPPPITRLRVKIHLKDRDYWTIDSTPLVGPDAAYCSSVGFTDGRTICPLRAEGAEDRSACEEWRAGTDQGTGKPGPTWSHIEYGTGKVSSCGSAPDAPCDHHPNGPFTVKAFRGGVYRVCTELGACGETDVDRYL
jgi:hypothetical protein